MSLLYDLGVLLGILVSLPQIVWKGKFGTFWCRFRSKPPTFAGAPLIWINAVSLGEVKSAKILLQKIKATHPEFKILVTATTSPGLEEARRTLREADAICPMPFDFSFVMRKWTRVLQPKLLLLMESDFWYHHMRFVKRSGGKIILVSGKISERSWRRFKKVPFFSKRLFSFVDHFLLQNEEYLARFSNLGISSSSLAIGGNLKFDAVKDPNLPIRPFIRTAAPCIAIISTHAPEEEELLAALETTPGTLFLAPRHPERFEAVAGLLEKKQLAYIRWTEMKEESTCPYRVVLVDVIGWLASVYAICDLAIVAGSFSSKIGGHNVLEPCLFGRPVFFGPHMHNQTELAAWVLKAGAAKQVNLSDLAREINRFYHDPKPLQQGAFFLSQQAGSSMKKSWPIIDSTLMKLGEKSKSLEINHSAC